MSSAMVLSLPCLVDATAAYLRSGLPDGDLADVVVGRVVQAARHPNADTLWVT